MQCLIWLLIILSLTACNHKHSFDSQILTLKNQVDIGIKIRNLNSNKVIFENNSTRYYNFASGLKFIILLSLREYFGADYLFKNTLYIQDQDLYLEINDPTFSSLDLVQLLKTLNSKNIYNNFYIVNKAFKLPMIAGSKMLNDTKHCYGAPISRPNLDKNCLKFSVDLNNKVRPDIYLINDLNLYKVVNKLKIVTEATNFSANISDDQLIVEGSLKLNSPQFLTGSVIHKPLDHLIKAVDKSITENSFPIKGEILITDQLPTNCKLLQIQTKRIDDIISDALKMSDNFVSDYLFASFADDQSANSWESAGVKLISMIRDDLEIDLGKANIVDASGLSRFNLLSVEHFDIALNKLFKLHGNKIFSFLAEPSKSGTLTNRFRNLPNHLKIYAKTGTMQGISSLVGYLVNEDTKNVYSFVIVINNSRLRSKVNKQIEERIIGQLFNIN